MKYKIKKYKLSNGYGDLPKGMTLYPSLHHRPILDGHKMMTVHKCGKGAAYSVPEGLLVPADE